MPLILDFLVGKILITCPKEIYVYNLASLEQEQRKYNFKNL